MGTVAVPAARAAVASTGGLCHRVVRRSGSRLLCVCSESLLGERISPGILPGQRPGGARMSELLRWGWYSRATPDVGSALQQRAGRVGPLRHTGPTLALPRLSGSRGGDDPGVDGLPPPVEPVGLLRRVPRDLRGRDEPPA